MNGKVKEIRRSKLKRHRDNTYDKDYEIMHKQKEGYILVHPEKDPKNIKKNYTYVQTLDEAAELIEKYGYHARIGKISPGLIQPQNITIIRDEGK